MTAEMREDMHLGLIEMVLVLSLFLIANTSENKNKTWPSSDMKTGYFDSDVLSSSTGRVYGLIPPLPMKPFSLRPNPSRCPSKLSTLSRVPSPHSAMPNLNGSWTRVHV